jgi:hypothetical protein
MLDLVVLLDQHSAELSPYYPSFPGKFSVYLPNDRGVLVTSQNLVYPSYTIIFYKLVIKAVFKKFLTIQDIMTRVGWINHTFWKAQRIWNLFIQESHMISQM